jgi:hypothetical protein
MERWSAKLIGDAFNNAIAVSHTSFSGVRLFATNRGPVAEEADWDDVTIRTIGQRRTLC